MLKGFRFEDGGRTYNCEAVALLGPEGGLWWCFTVSSDTNRYAPFRAESRDTRGSVQDRIVAYYTHHLKRRAEPEQQHWAKRGRPPAQKPPLAGAPGAGHPVKPGLAIGAKPGPAAAPHAVQAPGHAAFKPAAPKAAAAHVAVHAAPAKTAPAHKPASHHAAAKAAKPAKGKPAKAAAKGKHPAKAKAVKKAKPAARKAAKRPAAKAKQAAKKAKPAKKPAAKMPVKKGKAKRR